MTDIISLQGPVEKFDGKFTLRIPLADGGEGLIECSRGISEVEEDYLKIVIPDWLAGKLEIYEGCMVHVDNRNGKFNIWRCDTPPN